MSRQGSNHEIIELGEDEEDLDLPPPEAFNEAFSDEEDAWFESHDEWDDDPEEYDEPEFDREPDFEEYDEPYDWDW